jgi:hypothetical protein
MEMMQVTKYEHRVPVNVVDGVPQCSHGDPMIQTKPGEWMCPTGAAVLEAAAPVMARLDAMVADLLR